MPRVPVMSMTLARQPAVGLLLSAVVGVALNAACGAPPTASTDDFTARPPVRAITPDASDDGGAAEPVVVPPPEPLCALAGPPVVSQEDVLVFGDEFDGTSLDATKWTLRDGYRRTGILNYASAKQVSVTGGSLRVSAAPNASPKDPLYPYDAGFADTLGKFARTYGRIEFRARFPYEPGVWYAIWGRPWSASFPEIDIEVVNRAGDPKTQLYFVHHWAAPPLPADQRRAYTMLQEADYSAFRAYTIDWKPGSLTWQVDGVTKMVATGEHVPTLPVYWMVNAWVGGWTGNPTPDTKFPTTFEVDWMRVYRTNGVLADPLVKLTANAKASYARKDWLDVSVANFDEACAHVELLDGDKVVWTTSTAPWRIPFAVLPVGSHTLTITATDGVRRAETSFTTEVK